MKELFPGYYRPNERELVELWKECFFVLDANVLLNLYRYPKKACEDLLKVLHSVSNRLWIPYQVALEYQENRLYVIAEQIKKFDEVRSILGESEKTLRVGIERLQLSKRHPVIKADTLLEKVTNAFKEFKTELEHLEKQQPNVFDVDKLRDEIDSLVKGKVGQAPSNQEELNRIYEEGEVRYKHSQPPGFLDEGKNKPGTDDSYVCGGLCFKRRFGDLILWYQIIEEAQKRADFKKLIFVTDDDKEDWWWVVESKGKRTIGPRPELVEEIRTKAGVASFYMYNSESLMELATTYLGVKVEKESIERVRDLTQFEKATQAARMKWSVLAALRRRREEAADTELTNVQSAVVALMVDNRLIRLPNPVSVATNDMSAFPDATSAVTVDKISDPSGTAYAVGDKNGFILYQHDITADGIQTGLVNYVATRYTKGTYTVDASGTVTQVTTGF